MLGDNAAASLLWLVVCVVLITGLAYWFTRFAAGGGLLGTPARLGRQITLLAQLGLGKDQRLILVQAAGRYFLLGAAPAGISLLAEFTPEEAAAWQAQPEGAANNPSFREALETILKERKRR